MSASTDNPGTPVTEIGDLLAWARRLSDAGIGRADPAELAAFQHTKRALLDRLETPTPSRTDKDTR